MNVNIKEEVDDKSFILQNYKNEIEESETELKEIKIEIFQCEGCSEQFQIFELYEMHKVLHATPKTCPHCKRTFFKQSLFVEHIEELIKNYIKCEYCPKIFFVKQQYIYHWRWHSAKNGFQCTYCNKSFVSERQLSIHIRIHTEEPPSKCGRCGKTFKYFNSLHTQLGTHGNSDVLLCNVCYGGFQSTSDLIQQEIRMHDTGPKMTCNQGEENGNPKAMQMEEPEQTILKKKKQNRNKRCFLCGYSIDWTQMNQHQDTHLETMYDEIGECELSSVYRCKECGDILTTRRKALFHVDVHMKKTYACEHPDCHAVPSMTYMYYERHKYKLHKTVTCDDCKRQFAGTVALAKHRVSGYCPEITSNSTKMDKGALSLRVHENSVKPRRFNHGDQKITGQCKICNERFETLKSYEAHMKKEHGPHQCQKCKRKFSSGKRLRFHVKKDVCGWMDDAVTLNQDIFCKYCACCLSGVGMMEHLEKQHPDEDKYVCLLCEKTFKSFPVYLSHKKEHSGKRVKSDRYVVQLNEIICRSQVKKDPVDDNFVDVPEHVVVQQNGEVLSVVGDQ